MSKAIAMRKKALELVRKQDWPAAIKEYRKLADADQSNPNVYNELGDLYLKTGNKVDAYDAFINAIDAYTRVSLHNNAVAVAKKVLRVLPTRHEVFLKLGHIRQKQGLSHEAESYYLSYLEKIVAEGVATPDEVSKATAEISASTDSLSVLGRVVNCMKRFKLEEHFGEVLLRMYPLLVEAGDKDEAAKVRGQLEELGLSDRIPVAPKSGTVITEENIWTAEHTEGERMAVDDRSQDEAARSVIDYGDVEIDPAKEEATPEAESAPIEPTSPPEARPTSTPAAAVEEPAPAEPVAPPRPAPKKAPEPVPVVAGVGAESGHVHVSAIIGDMSGDGGGESTEADYRSHYDVGMAYLEMELLPEAIREFQNAAKSPQLQVKSLEMIGLCFLGQKQANLAIRQLTLGLAMLKGGEDEALGLKYNLGLAYELAGNTEKAREMFEDVYILDVSFREVAEKIKKYSQ